MTEEQKAAARERMAKVRAAKKVATTEGEPEGELHYEMKDVVPDNGNPVVVSRGIGYEPFVYEEHIKLSGYSGYAPSNEGIPVGAAQRAFKAMGANFEHLPPFDPGNKICVRIWVEPAG